MAIVRDVKGFALAKKFIHEVVFPKYPDIMQKIQAESLRLYKKQIFKPINDERKIKIQQMNKKSVYRQIQFIGKENSQTNNYLAANGASQDLVSLGLDAKNKILAEKIVSQNLNDNIGEIQKELTTVSEQIKSVVENCEVKLSQVIKEIEIMGSL